MSKYAIEAHNIGKQYRIGSKQEPYTTLRESIMDSVKAPFRRTRNLLRGEAYGAAELNESVWAVRNLSFEIEHGESIGIVGRNGAGKSTLLKILSRITHPTEGYAKIYGRVGSLLEVGTGVHPELTGRENVYLNAAILGMKRHEIDLKFDEIVDFSGVEKFLDTPVKHYSSGMILRLGFAVAAHLEPEILVVDEVLAVGDVEFQNKCLGKMNDVSQQGRTVLFVSHNMGAIARMCPKCILLKDGQIEYMGKTEDTIAHYMTMNQSEMASYADLRDYEGGTWGRKQRIITSISLHRGDDSPTVEFKTGETLIIRVGYQIDGSLSAYCQLNFVDFLGERAMTIRSNHEDQPMMLSGKGVIEFRIDDLRLTSGEYTIGVDMGELFPHVGWLDYVEEATRIRVDLGDYLNSNPYPRTSGRFAQHSKWQVIEGEHTQAVNET